MARKAPDQDAGEALRRFKSDLKAGTLGNFYIISGEEAFLRSHYVDLITKKIADGPAGEFNCHRFSADDCTPQALADAIDAMPMMAERTLVRVDDVDLFKQPEGAREQYAAIFSDLPDYCCVLFVYDTVEFKINGTMKKLAAAIREHAQILTFGKQSERDLCAWITRHFRAHDKMVTDELCQFLIFRTDGLMTTLAGEIDKIAAYQQGQAITRGAIDAVVIPALSAQTFDISDAVVKEDFETALSKLQELYAMQTDPIAVLGAIAAFGIGNIAQVNSIADSVKSVAIAFNEDAANKEMLICLITGICVAIFVALVLLGGVKRIGQVTEKLVPLMAVIYIVCALVVVFANISAVPGVFASIFKGAFNPAAVTGGAAGMSIKLAMTKGVGRGVFSNEAGLGSAPIAHAATSERNPVKQGLYGIFEVFMDTIVICTLTALVVLCSGAAAGSYGNEDLAGVPTAVAGFATVFGDKAGSLILAVGLLLFATSTILGWALYGTRCAEFLFGSKIIRPYQIVFCLVVVAGAVADLKLVWDISDTLNGLMSIPNLIALLLLSPVVIKVTKEHFAGLRK